MDHGGLRGLVFLAVGLSLFGCSASSPQIRTPRASRPAIESPLSPARLLVIAEQFLEWQKGFDIRIRDHDRGLIVTGWIQDSPQTRMQITVKVSTSGEGAYLTLHANREGIAGAGWQSLPPDAEFESELLQEIENYANERVKT